MKSDARFESIDRDMSSWVLTTVLGCTRFYVADNEAGTATDMLPRAKRYRWVDDALAASKVADREFRFLGPWEVVTVPEAIVLQGENQS